MWDDPIVAEVRRVREQLAAEFGFDAKAIFEDLRKRQTLGDRLVSRKIGRIEHVAGGSLLDRRKTDSCFNSPYSPL